ncbi:MAG: DUF2393 domain-containing protein [Sulfurimonas sp.]|nr:DUF2393 domain-containing protein [Sulfurimonas sp.]
MKEKITAFINELVIYDYILFGSIFALFLLFIILAIVLRKKVGLSIFLIIFSFVTLALGPTLGYIKMHEYLYKNSCKLVSQKRLSFTPAIVVNGTITNESRLDFKSCKITASVYKSSKNIIKKYLYPLKPLKNMSIVQENILKGETQEFKIIVEPFTYSKDYNISIKASCK